MKLLLVILLAISLSVSSMGYSYADKGTYVDSIQFIQYLDENTALEEVRNGNLDLYYYRIPSDRIESTKSRDGLQIFDSTGGSYSILVNPASSEKFNPFSIQEVRFALNYLVDRKLIVNELMGGFGTTMVSNYGQYDPDYLTILEQIESFHFVYNPALANEMISNALYDAGATKTENSWVMNDIPIEIILFIRSDDSVRKSIGEILASELEQIGFSVKKEYGDLNKAFVIVYGSNPADLKWSLYTEGWSGRSAFVKYDSLGLGQMYSPWFSNMPGFNDPTYWNYKNDYLDSITQKIYTGNFSSAQERTKLIQDATIEGVNESVRIFLASKIDQYVANDGVNGIINDFGAGVPTRFTPINSRTDSDSLTIGVKQIYQGAWNPIMGFSDSYSTQIWYTIFDPGIFKHPYTGENIPIRVNWNVETAGPDGKLTIPSDAILWNSKEQAWTNVVAGTQTTSKVTFDLTFSNWHNGQAMDMNDILHSLYFVLEWGSESTDEDKTFDTEYTPRKSQVAKTLTGIRVIDKNTIEVYVDYWHFDESEIANWSYIWSSMPWEVIVAMEQAVLDGKVSFSRSGAVSKSVNWLSLIVPHDSMIIKENLESFRNSNTIPASIEEFVSDSEYFLQRYDSTINWIESNNHAVISNGPFYLDRYSPESRTIQVNAFVDDSYPFDNGFWSKFEQTKFPQITGVSAPNVISKGTQIAIPVETENSSKLYYFFTNSHGDQVSTGTKEINSNPTILTLTSQETELFGDGANDLKVFVISDEVLRPDMYATSFLAIDAPHAQELPVISTDNVTNEPESETNYEIITGIIFLVVAVIVVGLIGKSRRKSIKNF